MVKRLLLLLLIIVPLALFLTTCDLFVAVFSLSPFPGYLSQAVASVYMGHEIEKFLGENYADWESDVFVLRNSTSEYVFLVVRKNPGPQMVFVFDTSLNLEVSHKIEAHRRIGLVEALNENFVVGGGQFDGNNLTILNPTPDPPYPPISDDTWHKYTFAHAGSNYAVWNEYDQLICTEYNSFWTNPSTKNTTIETGRERRLVGLGYENVIMDPELGTISTVYLFIYGWDSNDNSGDEFLYIVRTDANKFPGPIIAGDLVYGLPPDAYTSQRITNVRDNRPVYYTRKGVVAETRIRGTFRLLTLEGDMKKRFYITSDERTPFDFDIDGEYYYVFDEQNFRLYKSATGF